MGPEIISQWQARAAWEAMRAVYPASAEMLAQASADAMRDLLTQLGLSFAWCDCVRCEADHARIAEDTWWFFRLHGPVPYERACELAGLDIPEIN